MLYIYTIIIVVIVVVFLAVLLVCIASWRTQQKKKDIITHNQNAIGVEGIVLESKNRYSLQSIHLHSPPELARAQKFRERARQENIGRPQFKVSTIKQNSIRRYSLLKKNQHYHTADEESRQEETSYDLDHPTHDHSMDQSGYYSNNGNNLSNAIYKNNSSSSVVTFDQRANNTSGKKDPAVLHLEKYLNDEEKRENGVGGYTIGNGGGLTFSNKNNFSETVVTLDSRNNHTLICSDV